MGLQKSQTQLSDWAHTKKLDYMEVEYFAQGHRSNKQRVRNSHQETWFLHYYPKQLTVRCTATTSYTHIHTHTHTHTCWCSWQSHLSSEEPSLSQLKPSLWHFEVLLSMYLLQVSPGRPMVWSCSKYAWNKFISKANLCEHWGAETRSLLAMRSPLYTWEKVLLWWWTSFLKCVSSVPSGLRQSHPNPRRYRISLSFHIIDHAYHSFLLLWVQGTFKIQHCLLKNYLVHFQNSNWSIWLRDR